jgi:hypothetical protein
VEAAAIGTSAAAATTMDSNKEEIATEFQRMAKAEMSGSSCNGDKGCEELKMRNYGPWLLEEFKRAANP